jgi:hypothetical protein
MLIKSKWSVDSAELECSWRSYCPGPESIKWWENNNRLRNNRTIMSFSHSIMVMHKSSIFRLEECSDSNRSLAFLNITDLFSSSYFEQKESCLCEYPSFMWWDSIRTGFVSLVSCHYENVFRYNAMWKCGIICFLMLCNYKNRLPALYQPTTKECNLLLLWNLVR